MSDSVWSKAYRTPVAGPYSAQQLVSGVVDAIGQPITQDARRVKQVRNQNPTIDTLAGIHPIGAAAQMANDFIAGEADSGTAMNALQMIPSVKGLTGMAALITKRRNVDALGRRWVIDMPSTLRRNALLSAGQVLGQTNDVE